MKILNLFKTFIPKTAEVKPTWYLVDVKGETLGHISTKIADLLRGKNKTTFTKHQMSGDNVIVINAGEVNLTGKKNEQKMYYRHSRFPGGLKSVSPAKLKMDGKSDEILIHAVAGMIPNNKHKKTLLKRLKVFAGAEHNMEAQNPTLIKL